MENTIKSQELLKPSLRLPYQTTGFIYRALDIAEQQIVEQQKEIAQLRKDNLRLNKLIEKKFTKSLRGTK